MIRTLLTDAGFILATLVVALGSFFLIRAASGDAPRAEIATIRVTATPSPAATTAAASPSMVATTPAASATLAPTATLPPIATPSATPATAPAGGIEPLAIDAALGRAGPNICEAGVSTSEDPSKRRAVRSWNQITAIWNGVAESEAQLNAAIPTPFTLDNAAASPAFLAEARRHQDVVQSAIDDLVALRQAGIHTRTREMSLRQGDFYDLDRLTTLRTIDGAANRDVSAWNEAASFDEQRTGYLDAARSEMSAVCEYVKQP